MNDRDIHRVKRSGSRAAGLVFSVGLGLAIIAGCGSDDEQSAQDKYCEAGDALESSIAGLLDLDLIAEGTDGLESAVSSVESDVGELRDTASDAAADEVTALQDAVDGLESAISDLDGEISSDNLTGVASAISEVGSAAQAVSETLSDCPA